MAGGGARTQANVKVLTLSQSKLWEEPSTKGQGYPWGVITSLSRPHATERLSWHRSHSFIRPPPPIRTSWSSGLHSYLVFGRYRVQISARRSAIVTEAFRSFAQFLQANSGIAPLIRPRPLTSTTFPIGHPSAYHPSIQRCIVWLTEKASFKYATYTLPPSGVKLSHKKEF
jgi:hypothetical protein